MTEEQYSIVEKRQTRKPVRNREEALMEPKKVQTSGIKLLFQSNVFFHLRARSALIILIVMERKNLRRSVTCVEVSNTEWLKRGITSAPSNNMLFVKWVLLG